MCISGSGPDRRYLLEIWIGRVGRGGVEKRVHILQDKSRIRGTCWTWDRRELLTPVEVF